MGKSKLLINGTYIAQPVNIQVLLSDLDRNSVRDGGGTMYRNVLTCKRKVTCEWGVLLQTDMSQILQLVSDSFFTLTYFDPYNGNIETRTFYSGDRTATLMMDTGDEVIWKSLLANFTER